MPIADKYLEKFEPGEFYHVYNRCHSGKVLFNKPSDYIFFFDLMKKHLCDWMDFYTYCLLSNHFHLLVKIREEVSLNEQQIVPTHQQVSNQFRKLFIAHTTRVNLVDGLQGGLFNTPFRRILIDSDEYFTSALYYINHNAVHHKICKWITDYPYSAYNSLISNKPTLLKREEIFNWFGGRDLFLDYHNYNDETYVTKPFYFEDT